MWPWGHLAVGYLLYTALVRARTGRAPSGSGAVLVAFGTQFPDLVDKPLAWGLGVLLHGRTGAHSLPVLLLVVSVVALYARRRDRSDLALAFSVGYLTHPFADAFLALLQGQTEYVTYLLWPLTDPAHYSTDAIVLASFGPFDLTVYGVAQLGLVVLALGIWIADGTPGVATLEGVLGDGDERERTPDPDR
ncbi:metal-dependent hydrolase [Halobacteriales archaeon QS_8_65_32]|jgi:membrane-bound metal-dependent hydrolase YbcI (DUF457 family)|nr:MAG: metal-dependent hydrolase [Halobacteriales archaeon QS_8_65_32]